MRKKRETREELEIRIKKEEKEKYESKERDTSNIILFSAIGAIIGIVVMGGAGIGGAIFGAITGGMIGAIIAKPGSAG